MGVSLHAFWVTNEWRECYRFGSRGFLPHLKKHKPRTWCTILFALHLRQLSHLSKSVVEQCDNIMPKIPHSTNCIVCLSHFCTLFDCFAMHCTQGQVGSCWHFRVLWHVGVGKKPVSAKFKTFIGNKVVEWLSLWSYTVCRSITLRKNTVK